MLIGRNGVPCTSGHSPWGQPILDRLAALQVRRLAYTCMLVVDHVAVGLYHAVLAPLVYCSRQYLFAFGHLACGLPIVLSPTSSSPFSLRLPCYCTYSAAVLFCRYGAPNLVRPLLLTKRSSRRTFSFNFMSLLSP